jgi:hypothetical protein
MASARDIARTINGAYANEQSARGGEYVPTFTPPLSNSPATPNTGLTYGPLDRPTDPFTIEQILRQMVGPLSGGRT